MGKLIGTVLVIAIVLVLLGGANWQLVITVRGKARARSSEEYVTAETMPIIYWMSVIFMSAIVIFSDMSAIIYAGVLIGFLPRGTFGL